MGQFSAHNSDILQLTYDKTSPLFKQGSLINYKLLPIVDLLLQSTLSLAQLIDFSCVSCQYKASLPQQDHHGFHEWKTLEWICCNLDPHNLPREI